MFFNLCWSGLDVDLNYLSASAIFSPYFAQLWPHNSIDNKDSFADIFGMFWETEMENIESLKCFI